MDSSAALWCGHAKACRWRAWQQTHLGVVFTAVAGKAQAAFWVPAGPTVSPLWTASASVGNLFIDLSFVLQPVLINPCPGRVPCLRI